MKIELKHLAPYLPYGLKGNLVNLEYFDSQINKELYRIETGLTEKNKFYDITVVVGDCEGEIVDFKPILRPLSDLTKERIDFLWFEVIGVDRGNFDEHDFYEKCEIGLINLLPIMVYDKLFEWHFDVFELIPQGLAIDINTI